MVEIYVWSQAWPLWGYVSAHPLEYLWRKPFLLLDGIVAVKSKIYWRWFQPEKIYIFWYLLQQNLLIFKIQLICRFAFILPVSIQTILSTIPEKSSKKSNLVDTQTQLHKLLLNVVHILQLTQQMSQFIWWFAIFSDQILFVIQLTLYRF